MKKNNEILLSLVVCCYNVSDYLENMIDGLLNQINNQTLKDSNKIEIILVEDASTDNNKTKKICKKYERNFKNIKLVQHKNNKGLSDSRNHGMLASEGKYISFPDPDDELADGIVEKYIKIINKKTYDVICSGLIEKHWNNKGKLILTKEVLQHEKTAEGKERINLTYDQYNRNSFNYFNGVDYRPFPEIKTEIIKGIKYRVIENNNILCEFFNFEDAMEYASTYISKNLKMDSVRIIENDKDDVEFDTSHDLNKWVKIERI